MGKHRTRKSLRGFLIL
ncbi:hypothetical protein Goshw_004175 [Gossypium schwendimanii]|uniref:Uncharacterized protein n=1 Tax=Gossypium schwendimanii TaxID=34291 RepID=A0A7J9MRM5_GOSSC|nr:hypothetical protein [Gossypium schwendimanii]